MVGGPQPTTNEDDRPSHSKLFDENKPSSHWCDYNHTQSLTRTRSAGNQVFAPECSLPNIFRCAITLCDYDVRLRLYVCDYDYMCDYIFFIVRLSLDNST